MSDKLGRLEPVDLVQWAQNGVHFEASVALAGMTRLDVDRSRSPGEAKVMLIGSMDESGTERRIEGRIQARLPRVCQRCLESMDEVIDCRFVWFLARSESEYRRLDEIHESVLLCDERQDLMTLIEDELILSIAWAPMHERSEQCDQAMLTKTPTEGVGDETGIPRSSPFTVLRGFKDN